MKYSDNYLIFPVNRSLERSMAGSMGLLGQDQAAAATPDSKVTVADNFLYTRGNYEQHRFSSAVLEDLAAALEHSLANEEQAGDFLARAGLQNNLGNVLAAMGQQQRDAALYERAIRCFELALEGLDQGNTPADWAATQYNLGTALQALGRQQGDAKRLKAATDAYTNALLVWTRKETPEQWGWAMHQLGATFHAHGRLLKGNRTFQKSVVAYKNALAVLDADNYPFELAAAHNNCGAVLHNLGESEDNPERLEEAIRSYEKAWTVCMEQQLPIHLSVLCRVNKNTAKNVLAELKKDAGLAEEVADEFELIVECFPHALQPLCLKRCEEQMGKARSVSAGGQV